MSTSETIMSFLDDNKEKIGDDLYLQFSNLLLKTNESEKKNDFYLIHYLYPLLAPKYDSRTNIEIKESQMYIKLSPDVAEKIRSEIDRYGFVIRGGEGVLNFIPPNIRVQEIERYDNDTEELCEHLFDIEQITIIKITKV